MMSNYKLKTGKIAEKVVNGYKAIEEGVVGGYKKIESKFVDAFLEEADGESIGNGAAGGRQAADSAHALSRKIAEQHVPSK